MNTLSERLLSLSPSATFAMSARSAQLRSEGVDVINMSVGEPDFHTPDYIKNAAVKAIDDNVTTYSPVPGYEALRKAICEKLQRENGLSYTPAEIVVANGAKQAITDAVMALVNPGDEVIIPAPCWVSYIQMAKIAGGVPVCIEAPIEQDFKITPDQLEAAITPRTKLIILCSPSNPTGSIYSADELYSLGQVILRHDNLYVLSDEIYEHLNYQGCHVSIAAVPGMKARTIVINGVSKAYAMTGWRIGFSAAPQWISKGINMLQGHYSSGPCSVSQMAALAAWTQDWCKSDDGTEYQKSVEQMRLAFRRRRDLIVRLAKEIPGLEVNVPQGAFYLFPKCSYYFGKKVVSGAWKGREIADSSDFAMFLLEQAHVATVGGDAFGAAECFRMSYALSEDNIETALARISEAVKLLQ